MPFVLSRGVDWLPHTPARQPLAESTPLELFHWHGPFGHRRRGVGKTERSDPPEGRAPSVRPGARLAEGCRAAEAGGAEKFPPGGSPWSSASFPGPALPGRVPRRRGWSRAVAETGLGSLRQLLHPGSHSGARALKLEPGVCEPRRCAFRSFARCRCGGSRRGLLGVTGVAVRGWEWDASPREALPVFAGVRTAQVPPAGLHRVSLPWSRHERGGLFSRAPRWQDSRGAGSVGFWRSRRRTRSRQVGRLEAVTRACPGNVLSRTLGVTSEEGVRLRVSFFFRWRFWLGPPRGRCRFQLQVSTTGSPLKVPCLATLTSAPFLGQLSQRQSGFPGKYSDSDSTLL